MVEFIDYLWGIETGEYRQNPPTIQFVYRLPMRNWNENWDNLADEETNGL